MTWTARVRAGAMFALVAALLGAGVGRGAVIASAAAATAPKGRFALGDSVMLGAKSRLKALGFGVVDAVESRQAYAGPADLRRRGAALPRDVVIHLGTNGTFPMSTCKAMLKAVGPDRHVFLVTDHVPRSWTKGNNKVIRECAAQAPAGTVSVIDWDWAASRHRDWLYSDRTHLTPAGAKGYARVIDEGIKRVEVPTVGPTPTPSASG